MRITLDANILVYAVQRGDRRHERAVEVVTRAAQADCIQTLQSFGECFNALWRKRGFPLGVAREILIGYRSIFAAVVAASLDDLDAALRASELHRLQFWDAMLWATARRAGCRVIVTEDFQDGRELEGILFVDPFRGENAKLIDLALPKVRRPEP